MQAWPRPEPADIARLGRRLLHGVVKAARKDDPPTLADLLAGHLGPEVATLPVVGTAWPSYEHVNVQLALEHWLGVPGRTYQEVGVSQYQHRDFSLGDLAQDSNYGRPRITGGSGLTTARRL